MAPCPTGIGSKDVDEFDFAATQVNDTLVRELASGHFLAHRRNVVLVGGTGTGKTHLAIAVARACIRDGARGRFFNVVDLGRVDGFHQDQAACEADNG